MFRAGQGTDFENGRPLGGPGAQPAAPHHEPPHHEPPHHEPPRHEPPRHEPPYHEPPRHEPRPM